MFCENFFVQCMKNCTPNIMSSNFFNKYQTYKKYLIIGFPLIFLLLVINYVKYTENVYPLWWWFMPYARWLCDNPHLNAYQRNANLKCYFITRSYLYRYNIEELSLNPDLIMIREFYKDQTELDWIIRTTKDFSLPSPVYTLITDSQLEKDFLIMLDFRTSETMDFENYELRTLHESAERAAALNITNLDGAFNVLWYKRYGHIIPHHDVYPYSDSLEQGRRFVTFIVYIMEPDEGGATIFPKLNIAVQPRAGDAILFYNTFTNNEPDYMLSHAGCPVWKGEKIIGTFWFRQFEQEFKKPCPVEGDRFSFS